MSKRTLLLLGVLAIASLFAVVGCNNSSSVITPPPVDEQPVPAPQSLTANYTSNSALLSWAPSTSALVTGYNIYRYSPSPDRENAFVKVNASPVAQAYMVFTGPADATFFRVRAVTSTGREGASSSAYRVDAVVPQTPGQDPPPREGEL